MALVFAGRVEDVPPGRTLFVRLGGKVVILVHWAGCIYALEGICPHRNRPLEGASVWEYLLDCPWHHFQFDVRTGENVYPRNVYPRDMPELEEQIRALRTYPVVLRSGEIWVDPD